MSEITWEADDQHLWQAAEAGISKEAPPIIPWAEANVIFPSSVKSKEFKLSVSPWIEHPLRQAAENERIRKVTVRKPVQTSGSVIGEVLMIYWIVWASGFLQYNWPTKEKRDDRWNSRIDKMLRACAEVSKLTKITGEGRIGEIDFGRLFFRMQGVFKSRYLDSDSVTRQINEELHDWVEGHMAKADGRFGSFKLFKQVNISNAGLKGDQFDKCHRSGTMREWEVKCPGCGLYHRMKIRWDDNKPELGGLRYSADGARIGQFEYNYNLIRPTIRYQFPCRYSVHNDDIKARRMLSDSGRWSGPNNPLAEASHESYSYEAVIVHDLDWMKPIQLKHQALSARLAGNIELWIRYQQEVECIPYDPAGIPIVNVITLTKGSRKTHEGLPPPKFRYGTLDRQRGNAAELNEKPYWYLVVRDHKVFFGVYKSRLVFEGRLQSDEDVVKKLEELKVEPWRVCADSGDDTDHVYLFCMKNGYNAIKGGKEKSYVIEGARRMFSQERPLCEMIPCDPMYPKVQRVDENGQVFDDYDDREPEFWLYSKSAIAERLYWLRADCDYETPEDVSEEYKDHHDAEERRKVIVPEDNSEKVIWYQMKRRNEALVCERYQAMMFDMSGQMGGFVVDETVETENKTK